MRATGTKKIGAELVQVKECGGDSPGRWHRLGVCPESDGQSLWDFKK